MSAEPSFVDDRYMGLAIALGRRNLGRTWPNPSVGAVLVDPEGIIVAQGVTQPGGRPHAEIMALSEAGERARGTTLYVSLEPCSHHGRTPPCADAIVTAGVARVVTAIGDPNPLVAGGGHARLRAAGILVTENVRERHARDAHRGHLMRMVKSRPFVTLKLAQTADGYAGTPTERLRITGEAANARTHMLRAQADAILVGAGTVLADDPRLDIRLPGMEGRFSVRVVIDGRLTTSLDSHLARTAKAIPTWILTGAEAIVRNPAHADALREAGVQLRPVPLGLAGHLDLAAALRDLASCGLTALFCEGGPTLANALAEADFIDEVVLAHAPSRLGRPGIKALGPALQRRLDQDFRRVHSERWEPDQIAWYGREAPCSPGS